MHDKQRVWDQREREKPTQSGKHPAEHTESHIDALQDAERGIHPKHERGNTTRDYIADIQKAKNSSERICTVLRE